jgi:hypothetical protein
VALDVAVLHLLHLLVVVLLLAIDSDGESKVKFEIDTGKK